MHNIILCILAFLFALFSPFVAFPSLSILLSITSVYCLLVGIPLSVKFPISIHYIVLVLIVLGACSSVLFINIQVKYYTYLPIILLYIISLSLFSNASSLFRFNNISLAIFVGLSLPMLYGLFNGSAFELDRASIGIQGFSGNRANYAFYLSHFTYVSFQTFLRHKNIYLKIYSSSMMLVCICLGLMTSSRSYLLFLAPLIAYVTILYLHQIYSTFISSSSDRLLAYSKIILLFATPLAFLIYFNKYIYNYFSFAIEYTINRGWAGRSTIQDQINYYLDKFPHVFVFGTGGPDFLTLNSSNLVNLLDVGGSSTIILQYGLPGLAIIILMTFSLLRILFSLPPKKEDKALCIFCIVCFLNPASNFALNYNTYIYFFSSLYSTILIFRYRFLFRPFS